MGFHPAVHYHRLSWMEATNPTLKTLELKPLKEGCHGLDRTTERHPSVKKNFLERKVHPHDFFSGIIWYNILVIPYYVQERFLSTWIQANFTWIFFAFLDSQNVSFSHVISSQPLVGTPTSDCQPSSMDPVNKFTKWAVLKRSFISQGRRELLTPALTHHLRGHSASLRIEIPGFCLRASLRWLTHLRDLLTRTFLWPPPFLPHKGGFIAWLKCSSAKAHIRLMLQKSAKPPGM